MPKTPRKASKSKSKRTLAKMMREVHTNEPSTVSRAKISDARKKKMLKAIAFEKARKAGARV